MIKTCRLAIFAAALAPFGVAAEADDALPANPTNTAITTEAPAEPATTLAAPKPVEEASADEQPAAPAELEGDSSSPEAAEATSPPNAAPTGWYAMQIRGSVSAAGMLLSKCCELALPSASDHPMDLPSDPKLDAVEIAEATTPEEPTTEAAGTEAELIEAPVEETLVAAPADEPRPLAEAVDGYALSEESPMVEDEETVVEETVDSTPAVETEEVVGLVLVPNEPELLAVEEPLGPPEPELVAADEMVAEAADSTDIGLSAVTSAWPELSTETRQAILDMIDGELVD